ncbi:LTA synthase family protein [Isobaculum melis]|uniref:Phosphoglycerol transferase MdoB n=1 Tax=Isobaculum melis TaxID=142588 RepID=A0A1H9QNJ0_9LACT|nr:LTA synthase family protein [Isobaculum melis]SER62076.1 Phosphoglycerol transferase MdoB [Isobaculum melis]
MHKLLLPLNRWRQALVTGILCFLSAFINNYLLQIFQNQYDLNLAYKFVFEWHTVIFFLSVFVLFIVTLWLTALIGKIGYSTSFMFLLTIGIGLANQQKLVNRGEPLYPNELSMISEWPFLLKMLEGKWIILLILTILGVAAYSYGVTKLIQYLLKKWQQPVYPYLDRKNLIIRGITFLLTSLILMYTYQFNQEGNLLKKMYDQHAYWIPYSQEMNYYNNGFLGGFFYNFPIDAMNEPTNYSKEEIERIVTKYTKTAKTINQTRTENQVKPNIVFIMSESFSDIETLKGIQAEKDPMPETRKWMKQSTSGKILSQGYGGGTANIEFEALTGFSMYPFNEQMTTPYTMLLPQFKAFPSIVSYLAKEGYETTAIHPFNTSMYKRREVYDTLQFSNFLNEETMTNQQTIEQNQYISDEAAFKEIMAQLETQEDPSFVHLVTMQNHLPYEGNYSDTIAINSELTLPNKAAISNYLQGIAYSDQALNQFLLSLNDFNEPTVVVFWGDHLPSVYGDDVFQANELRTMYETPFLLYTNYPTKARDVGTISPIYFMNELLTQTETKVSPFYGLMTTLETEITGMEKLLLIDQENQTITEAELSDAAKELLQDYQMIQYDVTTGKGYSQQIPFFDPINDK